MPIPEHARHLLALIPEEFKDDGCTLWLDGFAGRSWRWACRIHDWRACSRVRPPWAMTEEARRRSDAELRRNILATVPVGWAAIPALVYAGLSYVATASFYDTCGADVGARCRHNMPRPLWMARP